MSTTRTSVAELLGDGGGLAVRQREEDDVVAGEHAGVGLVQDPVGQRQQMRLERAEPLPALELPVSAPISTSGCAEQQAQHLPARVPARSGHCRPYRHVHSALRKH